MQNDYDIIIIGAGMVGLACAIALADTPLRIAIIENNSPEFNYSNTSYDLRVSAINPATLQMLLQFDVWKNILAERVGCFKHMFVWSGNSTLKFSADIVHRPELGFIIENRILRKVLWEKTDQQNNIDILHPIKLTKVEIKANKAQLFTRDNKKITSNLLIGADGANSWLREYLNFSLKTHDYHQHAIVGTVKTEHHHQETAWQHFLPTGPLAFLPLSEANYCSIVWSTTITTAKHLQQIDESYFNREITKAFTRKLGKVEIQSKRICFPLGMQHLKNYIAPHIAFIGDAAHRIHPLAGQGVNLGFMDALCLADNIKTMLAKQKNIGVIGNLQNYQGERKYYNMQMLVLMDLLKNGFSLQSETLSQLRNLTMDKINNLTLIKSFLTNKAFALQQLPTNYLPRLV